jgi:hypothetical protein
MTDILLNEQKRLDHPVWMVYNQQRTACLNAKYYGYKLRLLERETLWTDVIIAIAAPTSGIAGLAMLQSEWGKAIWAWFPALATLLIIIKAARKTPARMKELEKRVTSYQALLFDMKEIGDKIRVERKFSPGSLKLYETSQRRYGALFRMPPDEIDSKLLQKYELEVQREMPASSFFIPEE